MDRERHEGWIKAAAAGGHAWDHVPLARETGTGKRRVVYAEDKHEAKTKLLSLQMDAGRNGMLATPGNKTDKGLLDLWLSTTEPTLKPIAGL